MISKKQSSKALEKEWKEKLKDICLVYDVEEYVNIEKEKLCNLKSSVPSSLQTL